VTAEEARARFARRFPELADLPGELGADPLSLPASLEAGVPGGGQDAARLAERLRGLPAVEDVRHDAAWSEALARLGRSVRAARAGIVALALAITGFGIANVVRIDALSRREELAIMRLVGAPALHLRLPFVLVGAVQGALGGAVATGVLAILARALSAPLALVLPAAAAGLPPGTAALLVGGAAVAGGAGAAVSVEGVLRRHARLER
jgi:cell division transport system permease protein